MFKQYYTTSKIYKSFYLSEQSSTMAHSFYVVG